MPLLHWSVAFRYVEITSRSETKSFSWSRASGIFLVIIFSVQDISEVEERVIDFFLFTSCIESHHQHHYFLWSRVWLAGSSWGLRRKQAEHIRVSHLTEAFKNTLHERTQTQKYPLWLHPGIYVESYPRISKSWTTEENRKTDLAWFADAGVSSVSVTLLNTFFRFFVLALLVLSH